MTDSGPNFPAIICRSDDDIAEATADRLDTPSAAPVNTSASTQ